MSPRSPGHPPPRRRVTAPGTGRSAAARVSPESGPATGEIRAIYLGALVRAQLRLGVLSAMAFLVTVAVAALLIASVESLHSALVFGVPWSWVLQAYGMYPIVVVFAAFYVGAARRNERRFRQLERSG